MSNIIYNLIEPKNLWIFLSTSLKQIIAYDNFTFDNFISIIEQYLMELEMMEFIISVISNELKTRKNKFTFIKIVIIFS